MEVTAALSMDQMDVCMTHAPGGEVYDAVEAVVQSEAIDLCKDASSNAESVARAPPRLEGALVGHDLDSTSAGNSSPDSVLTNILPFPPQSPEGLETKISDCTLDAMRLRAVEAFSGHEGLPVDTSDRPCAQEPSEEILYLAHLVVYKDKRDPAHRQ